MKIVKVSDSLGRIYGGKWFYNSEYDAYECDDGIRFVQSKLTEQDHNGEYTGVTSLFLYYRDGRPTIAVNLLQSLMTDPAPMIEQVTPVAATVGDVIYRLRKRAEIRRQISTRKSVQEGKPDRIADLLEEAAAKIEELDGRLHEATVWDHSESANELYVLREKKKEAEVVIGLLKSKIDKAKMLSSELQDALNRFK